jgi:hypothetical protein
MHETDRALAQALQESALLPTKNHAKSIVRCIPREERRSSLEFRYMDAEVVDLAHRNRPNTAANRKASASPRQSTKTLDETARGVVAAQAKQSKCC